MTVATQTFQPTMTEPSQITQPKEITQSTITTPTEISQTKMTTPMKETQPTMIEQTKDTQSANKDPKEETQPAMTKPVMTVAAEVKQPVMIQSKTTSPSEIPEALKTSVSSGVFPPCLSVPSTWHAVVAVFLQFFSWSLVTAPAITILNKTFQKDALLINGIIMGVKGILSFLSAPLIGSLSDVWGRKVFLLVCTLFTCLPIPFLKVHPIAYFILMAASGLFSIIFSVAFAYVADVTDESSRSFSYGLVTAGFAASLITGPAVGAWIEMELGGDTLVVALATSVAVLDLAFIFFMVPESLPKSQKLDLSSLTFKQIDPFTSLKGLLHDPTILLMSAITFLSYLPEAGQSTCFFVYIRLVLGFSKMNVAVFICMVGILSAAAQTGLLTLLDKYVGPKKTIMIGLTAQMIELVWYGVSTELVGMWIAGIFVAVSSITYPAISAFLSIDTKPDQQGAVQGTLMGVRGLCNGLGPALFGLMFYLFGIDVTEPLIDESNIHLDPISHLELLPHFALVSNQTYPPTTYRNISTKDWSREGLEVSNVTTIGIVQEISDSDMLFPGLPFVVGAMSVICAILSGLCLKNINLVKHVRDEESAKNRESGDLEKVGPAINVVHQVEVKVADTSPVKMSK